ncbi:hypothetical protein PIB30_007926 [Stylosanthes scabra]|uniref:Uncharacterized protein n=1 Tax=Stylosanthes scabra TaxID=79078 RepID=A0ABU6S536_9FABA|nr:hypothetical protein [Stylosanthes scabra]
MNAEKVDIIVNDQLPNTENEDRSAEEEGNSEDNNFASTDSVSTEDDDHFLSGHMTRGDRCRGRGIGGRRGRPRKRTIVPLDLGAAEVGTSTPPVTSTPGSRVQSSKTLRTCLLR